MGEKIFLPKNEFHKHENVGATDFSIITISHDL
jgi:hypothetical protein